MHDTVRFHLDVGSRFRGLLIHGVLGEGAMGAAYLASHPVLRTPLVVKTFKQPPSGDELFEEAYLAARVASPYVVGVVDAGVEDGMPFLILQHIDGIDLRELLDRRLAAGGWLPFERIAALGVQVARGLHEIHRAGVVHCDIKPENLFLRGSGQALVGDLGIAVDPTRSRNAVTIAGTPLFMAPERWMGKEVDRRADLYALGATLHVLATGRAPFEAPDFGALRHAHLSAPYVPPPAAEPREAFLYAIIEKMMRKDRDQRYPTAEAAARELELVAAPAPRYQIGDHEAKVGDLRVALSEGDLAEHEADVIVNAANWRLTMDVGVARALSAKAGPTLADEARARAPVNMGDVVWTSAGALRARWVAHAVSALAGAVCIQRCTLRALLEAEARGAATVAFPALGAGVGGVPMELGAKLTLEAIATFASLRPQRVREVHVVLFDAGARARWAESLSLL